jgi:hypothetical protein
MKTLRVFILAVMVPLLSACTQGQNILSQLANDVLSVLTFIGIGVGVIMLMFGGMNIIVSRLTGSSRGISESVKNYIIVGSLLIVLLLLPQFVRLTVGSLGDILTTNVNALDKAWGSK